MVLFEMQKSILLKSPVALFTMVSAAGEGFLCLAGNVTSVVWAEVVLIQQVYAHLPFWLAFAVLMTVKELLWRRILLSFPHTTALSTRNESAKGPIICPINSSSHHMRYMCSQ